MRMPVRAAALAAAAGGALLAGCRDSASAVPAPTPILGTFALHAVDGQALPATAQPRLGGEVTVQAGAAEFGVGGVPGADQWMSLFMSGETPSNPGVALGSTMPYSQPVADSVVTLEGAGRIRRDTLVFRTVGRSMFGAHEWRYTRVATP